MSAEPDRGAMRPAIVAVDDDSAVLEAIRGDLRSEYGEHYRVIAAGGGAAAIELLKELKLRDEAVALVVSDQRMPDVSGSEVLKAARELFAGVRTVLLTAYADTDVAIGAINDLRLDYYILKPWDPPEERLYPILDDLLAEWHANRQLTRGDATIVIGTRWSAGAHRVRDYMQRNQIPMRWLDIEVSEEARRYVAAADDERLPLVLTPAGQRLVDPDVPTLAAALGQKTRSEVETFELAIVGAGPAGLAAAVYGASEGLSTVCIEASAPGGQAGQSSLIENYLGFLRVSGAELARRAVVQARRFDVELLSPARVTNLNVDGPYPRLGLGDGSAITCRALILACGVSYNSLEVPGAAALEGCGVFYGAAMSERDAVAGEEVLVVGGANSAGQAAVYFAEHAARVIILCRATSLDERMSAYLVDQIARTPNIEVRSCTEVREVWGDARLERVRIEHTITGETEDLAASAVFIFIGASPHTGWLPPHIATDELGFVLTGPALGDRRYPSSSGERDPYLFETSVPGVFAVGDVRSRSVKRVASAVGEGAVAVQFVHEYLRG